MLLDEKYTQTYVAVFYKGRFYEISNTEISIIIIIVRSNN